MTSPLPIPAFVRQHVRDDGTPKDSYANEEWAAMAGRGCLPQKYAYHCTLCDAWHLASGKRRLGSSPVLVVPWYGEDA